jgi:putative addiction module component (TIGR02574 family)
MSELLLELSARAKALSPEERAELAEILLESLEASVPPELGAQWEREIGKRVAAYERGESTTYAAEDVFADARRLAR